MIVLSYLLTDRPAIADCLVKEFSLRRRWEVNVDVLSDVLHAIRLTGAIFFDVNARDPWVAETPPISAVCAKLMPEHEHVIGFHVMLNGRCWAQVDDGSDAPIRLEAGDAVIFTAGDAHYLGSEIGKRSKPNMAIYYRPTDRILPFVLRQGGSGEAARFVCGYLGCDLRPFNPILGTLPRVMHVRQSSESGALIHDLIRVALQESDSPSAGSETILSKLSELMFLQAIRQHIENIPENTTGWLSGLRDRHIGAALVLMHGRPAEAWTLDALAREVGLSRSVFAQRFSEMVGVPAMQYLSNWRLQIASRMLIGQRLSIAEAAAKVGYESEAAFNRAFKKRVGMPPGEWRRASQR